MQQDLAADRLLAYDHGVLSAATAFGETVVCSYLISERKAAKQTANAIYDSGNYGDVFERDLVEAEKSIVVSGPELVRDKVDRFLYPAPKFGQSGLDLFRQSSSRKYV